MPATTKKSTPAVSATTVAATKKPASKAATGKAAAGKATAAAATVATAKTSARTSKKSAAKVSETQLSNNTVDNGPKKTSSKDVKVRNLKFDKRVALPILGVIILLILGYLANRYLVVAWVDAKPITRFAYYNDLSKRYGKDEMEQLIVQKLIESEADKKGVSASDAEIKAQVSQIEQQQGGASQLDQVLQMQNLSRSDLNNLVKLQILRQKLFGSQINISDADVNNYMTENAASLPPIKEGDASGAAQLKESVKQQLLQQAVSATFSAWLQQNENSNRVVKVSQ
jgi:hypothetical protein